MTSPTNENFNLQFVKDIMNQWTKAAINYDREAEKSYSKLRSYLTLYQFRLADSQKHDIREMLSQSLDEIEKLGQVDDMDNYLDGFCFKLDPSVLPTTKPKPTSVKIQVAPDESPQSTRNESQVRQHYPDQEQNILETFTSANLTENADFTDFYQLQFYQ